MSVTDETDVTQIPVRMAVTLDALLDGVAASNRAARVTLAEVRTVKFLAVYAIILTGIVIYKQGGN